MTLGIILKLYQYQLLLYQINVKYVKVLYFSHLRNFGLRKTEIILQFTMFLHFGKKRNGVKWNVITPLSCFNVD